MSELPKHDVPQSTTHHSRAAVGRYRCAGSFASSLLEAFLFDADE